MTPPELLAIQPYSMGPILGWHPELMKMATPAMGTVRRMDLPELVIRTCLVAPREVQRQARALGVNGLIMIRVKGLREALGMDD